MFKLLEFPEYSVSCEVVDGNYFLHVTVGKWSLSVYKHMLTSFVVLMHNLRIRGVNYVFMQARKTNTKLMKFAEMFGFSVYSTVGMNVIYYSSTEV